MYLVEGVVCVKKVKISKLLPWVFHQWWKPRTLELDKGLGSWYECEIRVTSDKTEGKAKNGQKLEVLRISGATPSVKGDKECDLQVPLWVKSKVLKELAPCLLEKHNRDPSMCFNDIWSIEKLFVSQRWRRRFRESSMA